MGLTPLSWQCIIIEISCLTILQIQIPNSKNDYWGWIFVYRRYCMIALAFLQSLVETNQVRLWSIRISFSDQHYQPAQIPFSTFDILQHTALPFLSLMESLWISWAGLCSGIENTRTGPIQRQLFDAWASSQTYFWKGKDIGNWAFFLPQQQGDLQEQFLTENNTLYWTSICLTNLPTHNAPSSKSWLLSPLSGNYIERNARKAMFNSNYIQVKWSIPSPVSFY